MAIKSHEKACPLNEQDRDRQLVRLHRSSRLADGKAVQVIRADNDPVLAKWANGTGRLMMARNIGKQVEDAVPGITEPCLIYGGKDVIPIIRRKADESWLREQVGVKPCPNCRGLH
jgi:hypothetical protein